MPNIEYPEEFNRLILDFLSEDRGSGHGERG